MVQIRVDFTCLLKAKGFTKSSRGIHGAELWGIPPF